LEEAESGLIQHTERILAQGHAGPNRREQERRGRRERGGREAEMFDQECGRSSPQGERSGFVSLWGLARDLAEEKKGPWYGVRALFAEKQGSPL